ncbi:MAG: aldo/keto reductase [Acidimicrobiia bacterium]
MLERKEFGRTGHASSRVIFGGAALGRMRQERADELLQTLLDFGVNHIDVAASYGDAELRVAPWMKKHRADFFLATKTGDRTGEGSRASLERSLERLGVDQVDLIQLHNLVEPDEWETAHAPRGAVEALAKARDEGLTRFIGVTGHGLRIASMHLRSLEAFDFDSVLFPFNFSLLQNNEYRRDVEKLLDLCKQRKVATQVIKSIARRRWGETEGPRFSWYEPITAAAPIGRAVRYVLANPQLFLISSSDARVLRLILEATSVQALTAPDDEEMMEDVASEGIAPLFDGSELERI